VEAIAYTTCFIYCFPDYLLPRGSGYFSSQTFSRIIPHILNRSHTSHLLAYEDGMECSETLALKLQTPGNHPEESIQYSENDESLKCVLCLLAAPAANRHNTDAIYQVPYVQHFLRMSKLCSKHVEAYNSQ
jgi:hypothetical protein